jgi:ketosteroid isomerase-like protein
MANFNPTEFAKEWLQAWNNHDLDAILAHYAETIEFTSPFALKLAPESEGKLHGKAELRRYFARALEAYPDLHFQPLHTTSSVGSVVLIYRSVNDLLAAEMMEFDEDGKVSRVLAHYGDMPK